MYMYIDLLVLPIILINIHKSKNITTKELTNIYVYVYCVLGTYKCVCIIGNKTNDVFYHPSSKNTVHYSKLYK